jgi:hypothetical protein
VNERDNHTRRDLIKGFGATAGALSLGLDPLFSAPAPETPNTFPQLTSGPAAGCGFCLKKPPPGTTGPARARCPSSYFGRSRDSMNRRKDSEELRASCD